MYTRTEGIVLRNRPHHDADLIVSYLTPDLGIINLYARSPRKIKSRFGSSLEPLTYSKISFFGKENANLPRLTQSDIIIHFNHLRESASLLLKIYEMLELTMKLIPEREPNRAVFSLLLNMLKIFEDEPTNSLSFTYYKIRLLLLTGFAPKIGDCVRCDSAASRFYMRDGATLCNDCTDVPDGFVEVRPPVERLYSYLLKIGPSVLNRLHLTDDTSSDLEGLINSHIRYTVTGRLNTAEYAEAVKR